MSASSKFRQANSSSTIDWSRVWDDHGRWLKAILISRVRDRELADELFQEMALVVSRNPQSWPDLDKVAPWLYRVAIRQFQLYRRKQARDQLQPVSLDQANLVSTEMIQSDEQPLDWMLAMEARQQLRESLEQVSAQEREILMLKHGMQWSYREIADRLGISQDKVIYRIARAREKLRGLMNQYEAPFVS